MAINFLLKRSNTASKRPTAAQLDIGELSLNYEQNTCGVYFEDSNGDVRKVGPVEVSSSAPNSTPAGSSGNSLGELWYDTGSSNLKVWTGASFVSATSSVAAGGSDTQVQFNSTGSLAGSANFTFDGTSASIAGLVITGTSTFRAAATQDGVKIVGRAGGTSDYDVTVTPTTLSADRTLTLPDVTGTVVTTGDTGSVTSTMILDGTIVDGDVNASAAIAGTKIDPDFGSQTVETTGVFSAAGGAEATPSITFTGDLNTGFWSPSADTIAVSTAGSERLRVTDDGKFGIGTDSPSVRLEVSQDYGSDIRLTDPVIYGTVPGADPVNRNNIGISWYGNTNTGFGSSTAIGEVNYIRSVLTDTSIGNSSTQGRYALAFGVKTSNQSVTERVRINHQGNVGIGTTTPSALLHTVGGKARFDGDGGTNTAVLELQPGSAPSDGVSLTATYTGAGSYGPMIFATGGSESARIDSSGRLLVGTSSSSETCSAVLQGNSAASTGNSKLILARGTNSIAADGTLGLLSFSDSGHVNAASLTAQRDGGTWTSGSSQPTRLVFSTTADGASSPTERMRIDSSGRVGIGKTPSTVLDIGTSDTTAYSTSDMPIDSAGCITIFNTDATVLGSYAGLTLKTYGDSTNRTEAGIGVIKTTSFDSNGALVLGVRNNSFGNVIERMRLDSGGNIGMGTSSPASYTFGNLTVARSSGDAGITIAATSTTDRSVLAFADGTSGDAAYRGRLEYDHSDDSMRINTAAARAVFIDSSQQTGFGTDTPGARVHIQSSVSGDQLRVGTGSSEYYKIGRDTGNGLLVFDGVQSGFNGYIFTGADGERARIDSSGRFLVGVASASGNAVVQAASGMSYSANSGRSVTFTKNVSLSDNVTTTVLTIPVPAFSNFGNRFRLGLELSYAIQVGRFTSSRANQCTFGKVYVAVTRYWENSANAPVTADINTSDVALEQAGGTTTPTWTLSQDAGTDQAAKNVYVEVTMNNPYANSTYTEMTFTAQIVCNYSLNYT